MRGRFLRPAVATRGGRSERGCCPWISSLSSRSGRRDPGGVHRESTATSLDCCGSAGEYSRKVPQPTRTRAAEGERLGTVTCGDGRGWTCCLLMACKRSGVRVLSAGGSQDLSVTGTIFVVE